MSCSLFSCSGHSAPSHCLQVVEKDGLPYYIYELTRHRLVAATATGVYWLQAAWAMCGSCAGVSALEGQAVLAARLAAQHCSAATATPRPVRPTIHPQYAALLRCRQPAVHAERALQQPAVAQGGQQIGKDSGLLPGAPQDRRLIGARSKISTLKSCRAISRLPFQPCCVILQTTACAPSTDPNKLL